MATKDATLGIGLFIILFMSLVINCLFLVTFFIRRRLRSSSLYVFLAALAFINVLVGGSWTGLSAAASLIGWELPSLACKIQSYLFTLNQLLDAMILATVSLERLLRMAIPSRHAIIFVPKVTTFLIGALVVFCGVISSIHLYGQISVSWHTNEHQCGADFTENLPLLNMTFALDHIIPFWVVALPAFVAAFIKVIISRRSPSPYGEIILERNAHATGDSYSSRLAKLQSKFGGGKNKKNKGKKTTLGKRVYTSRGYTELEHWDSDIDDGTGYGADNLADGKQRTYALPRPEFSLLVMASLVTAITSLLWLPWIIVRQIGSNTPRDPPQDWAYLLAVVCMHSTTLVKPLICFLTNAFFRSALLKTVMCCKYKRNAMIASYQYGAMKTPDNKEDVEA